MKEGEFLSLPCRWCKSLSIRFRIRPGVFDVSCAKCGKTTRFKIRAGQEGLEIRSEKMMDPDWDESNFHLHDS